MNIMRDKIPFSQGYIFWSFPGKKSRGKIRGKKRKKRGRKREEKKGILVKKRENIFIFFLV